MNSQTLKMALYALKEHYNNADQIERIIINCALVAAAADGIGSAIPGISVPVIILGCTGAVWTMYGMICRELGIHLKENVLKLLARAALTNIAANLGSALLTSVVGLLVPGASVAVGAAVTFVTVYLAGLLFVQLLGKLAAKSSDPTTFNDISESEMKKTLKDTKVGKEDLETAKEVFAASKA